MERSSYCLVLALLVLLSARGICGDGDEDNGRGDQENRADGEFSSPIKSEHSPSKRAFGPEGLRAWRVGLARGSRERPLECFVCAYKSESPLRACLDPEKSRVPALPCRGADEECFAEVLPQGGVLKALVRGCRSHCVGSADTSCCEFNRCNSQAFAAPQVARITSPFEQIHEEKKLQNEWSRAVGEELERRIAQAKKTSPPGTLPPGTLLFVAALLVIWTTVEVLFV